MGVHGYLTEISTTPNGYLINLGWMTSSTQGVINSFLFYLSWKQICLGIGLIRGPQKEITLETKTHIDNVHEISLLKENVSENVQIKTCGTVFFGQGLAIQENGDYVKKQCTISAVNMTVFYSEHIIQRDCK